MAENSLSLDEESVQRVRERRRAARRAATNPAARIIPFAGTVGELIEFILDFNMYYPGTVNLSSHADSTSPLGGLDPKAKRQILYLTTFLPGIIEEGPTEGVLEIVRVEGKLANVVFTSLTTAEAEKFADALQSKIESYGLSRGVTIAPQPAASGANGEQPSLTQPIASGINLLPVTDPTDQRILDWVTKDPNLTDAEIGQKLGISRQAVNPRRKRLEAMGHKVR